MNNLGSSLLLVATLAVGAVGGYASSDYIDRKIPDAVALVEPVTEPLGIDLSGIIPASQNWKAEVIAAGTEGEEPVAEFPAPPLTQTPTERPVTFEDVDKVEIEIGSGEGAPPETFPEGPNNE